MRLRAREPQTARIDALDMDVDFERGEDILTEISCKFTRAGLTREYAAAGLELVSWHTDARGRFALSLTAPDADASLEELFPGTAARPSAADAYADLRLAELAPAIAPT